jgi:hypothetical protein
MQTPVDLIVSPHMQNAPLPQGPAATMTTAPTKTSGMAIASLVCGILALCIAVPGLLGVIFGILAIREINRSGGAIGGKGLAIGGLVTSAIGVLVVGVLVLGSMLLPALARAKAKANRIKCVNNLSYIGKATLGFSEDNSNRTPWNLIPSQSLNHFGTADKGMPSAGAIFGLAAMKSELQTAKLLVSPCDAARMVDNEMLQAKWANIDTKGGNPVTAGTSYIFCQGGDFQRPATVVALTRNLASNNIAAGGWSGADESPTPTNAMTGLNKSQGQLVRADGSAIQSTDADLGSSGKVVKGHIAARGGTSPRGPSSTAVIR